LLSLSHANVEGRHMRLVFAPGIAPTGILAAAAPDGIRAPVPRRFEDRPFGRVGAARAARRRGTH
jgi:hypothetical protein